MTRNAAKRKRPIVGERAASGPVLASRGAALVPLIALVVAPWLPWQQHDSGWEMVSAKGFADLAVAVVFGLATVVAWLATFARHSRWAAAAAVIVTVIGTAAVLAGALAGGPGWPGVGLGLALVAFPILMALAIPLALTSDRRLPRHFSVAQVGVVLAAVVVTVAVVGYGGNWYASSALTSTTTTAAPAPAPTGPAGTVLWSVSAGPDAVAIALPGGLVALQHVGGADISVRDAATGAQRWHYTRNGASLSNLLLSDDGSTLIGVYRVQDNVAIGFDPATGATRWQQSFGDTFLPLPAALLHLDGTQLSAYAPDTGRPLWQTSLGQPFCGNTGSLATGAGLVVALAPCVSVPSAKTGDVVALDPSGHVRWTSPTQAQAQDSSSSQVTVVSRDAVVANLASAMQTLVLDPATGHVRWTADASTETVQAVGDGVALTSVNGRITLRNVVTGTPASTQPPADLVPAGATVAAATISGNRGYVLVNGDHPRLAVVDIASGQALGSYPLPGSASSGTVQASSGTAVVTTQSGSSTVITAITT